MANETKNVLAGTPLVSGGILVGPLATAAPTDATTALAVGFKATGYIGEDGLTETVDRSTDKIRAWGGDTVKVVQSDFSVTYQFTFLETLNTDVLKAVYGDDNVTVTAATATAGTLRTVLINGDKLPQKSYVFEVKDDDARIRIYVPKGQVIEVGDVTYNDTDVIGYQVTVEAFKDATLNANSIKFIDDGVFSA
jgi:hypothetical protein